VNQNESAPESTGGAGRGGPLPLSPPPAMFLRSKDYVCSCIRTIQDTGSISSRFSTLVPQCQMDLTLLNYHVGEKHRGRRMVLLRCLDGRPLNPSVCSLWKELNNTPVAWVVLLVNNKSLIQNTPLSGNVLTVGLLLRACDRGFPPHAKLKFFGTNSNTINISILICTARHWGIWVFQFGEFRGCCTFGNCHTSDAQ